MAAALPCKPVRRYEAQSAEAARHDPAPLLQGRLRVWSEFKLYGVSGANQTLTHDAFRSWLHRKLSSSSVKWSWHAGPHWQPCGVDSAA